MYRRLVCAALLFAALPALADDAAVRRLVESRLMPGDELERVLRSPYEGLYEVDVRGAEGPVVYYVNPSATLIFPGPIIDARSGRNLTQERLHALSVVKWQSLPLKLAIKAVRGTGASEIAVFSDPNCPYCRRFEKTLTQIDNITVYTFLYPILTASSVPLAESVWCSKDRAKAWQDLMLRRVRPSAAPGCESPIKKIVALGRSFGAVTTPTWFLPDGKRFEGAMSRTELVKLLDAASPRRR
ncbi:MAG TPA: DsbC family protein [Burkholderiales bacterium]|nr:DsbC family protein [Burkholderiales bacterium]